MRLTAGLLGFAAVLATPVLAQPVATTPPVRDAEPQTRAELEARLRTRFGGMDTNKDGTVSTDEMRAYAQTEAKARYDREFVEMDSDRNGQISRAEFDAQHLNRSTGRGMGGMRGMAGMMGMRGGDVSVMSFRNGQGMVINDVVADALQRFDATDANKDGRVTPEERRAMRDRLSAARGGREGGRGSAEQPEQDQ